MAMSGTSPSGRRHRPDVSSVALRPLCARFPGQGLSEGTGQLDEPIYRELHHLVVQQDALEGDTALGSVNGHVDLVEVEGLHQGLFVGQHGENDGADVREAFVAEDESTEGGQFVCHTAILRAELPCNYGR